MRLAAAATLTLLVTAGGLAMRPSSPHVDGEYGLWVEDRGDSLVVHWLSAQPAAGSLVVEADTRKTEHKTPAATVHAVAMQRPRARTVRLIYGTPASLDTTTLYLQNSPRAAVATGSDSVYVIGDTHGEFDHTLRSLRQAGLIDEQQRWSGRRNHLVFVGDLVDRGEDVVPLLWLVYRLEREAAQHGGRVHVVLGNHETMVWMNDLRYVQQKEKGIALAYGVPYPRLFDSRESVLGRWLITKPAVLRVDNILFAHGGVSAEWLKYTPQTLDDTLAKFVKEDWFYRFGDTAAFRKATSQMDSATYAHRADFFLGENSVFWYRGYVTTETAGPMLDSVLNRFGATVHVVAHTPTQMVHQRYGGKLIAAHPARPAIEMVLLVKNGRNWDRFRIDQSGARSLLPSAP